MPGPMRKNGRLVTRNGKLRVGDAGDPCCCAVPCCLPATVPTSITVVIPGGSYSTAQVGSCNTNDVLPLSTGTMTHTGSTLTVPLELDDTFTSSGCRRGVAYYAAYNVLNASYVGTGDGRTAEWVGTIDVFVDVSVNASGTNCNSGIVVALSGPCSTSNAVSGVPNGAFELDSFGSNTQWKWAGSWIRNGTDGLVAGGSYDITLSATGQTVTVQL